MRCRCLVSIAAGAFAASLIAGAASAGAARTTAAPTCHLAGTWTQTTDQVGSTVWTITADGKATEGPSNSRTATGTATLSGNDLTITWTSATGSNYAGTYRWTLDAQCHGTGKLNFTRKPPDDMRQNLDSTVIGPPPQQIKPPCNDCVTVSGLQRKVEVSRAEGGWEPATAGMELHRGDRMHTGFKADVVLTFPGGSRLHVGDMALIQVNDVGLGPQGGIRARVFLKLGEVTAEVNRSTGASGDFQVKTPTTTASVRGTVFSVRFDGSATTVAVTKSSVQVTANNGATATVPAGMETRSTATSVAAPAAIGHGFKSGGLTDTQAIARLSGSIAKGLNRCKLGVVSNRLSPVTGGWSIGLVIVGANQGIAAKPKGTASFRLAGTLVKPGNKLAKRIAAGCR